MTYFGRAETLTRVRLAGLQEVIPRPTALSGEGRTSGAAPVLTPLDKRYSRRHQLTTDRPGRSREARRASRCALPLRGSATSPCGSRAEKDARTSGLTAKRCSLLWR